MTQQIKPWQEHISDPALENVPFTDRHAMEAEIAELREFKRQVDNMRHPKIQQLIGSKAYIEIQMRIVEKLLEFGPDYLVLTLGDMEYWGPTHDKLRQVLQLAKSVPTREQVEKALKKLEIDYSIQSCIGSDCYDQVGADICVREAIKILKGTNE